MTKKQQNNHPGIGFLTKIGTMVLGLRIISEAYCGLFKIINSFTKRVSFRENMGRGFAVKKNTEILEGIRLAMPMEFPPVN